MPLAAFVDAEGDDGEGDALAITLEADGSGAIYPVLYLRRAGRVEERPIDPDPLLRFDTPASRASGSPRSSSEAGVAIAAGRLTAPQVSR